MSVARPVTRHPWRFAIVPETVTREQYRPPQVLGHLGIRSLFAAVLHDAVRCLQFAARDTRHARQLREETEAWFASEDVTSLFSFRRVCGVLDCDPDWIRRRLHTAAGTHVVARYIGIQRPHVNGQLGKPPEPYRVRA